MATLHVRNVPDRLYRRIHRLAQGENRSLTAEVIDLLGVAVEEREALRDAAETLERIRRGRIRLPPGSPDSVELLAEDRRR
jgi:plasmid stability protein